MINNHDRSGWFGASDTAMIMGNWETKSFAKWWLQKIGLNKDSFTNEAMQTGTYFETKILDFLGIKKRDRQIRIYALRLRVNLDGEDEIVHEVKTHYSEFKRVPKNYWQQAQVEMFATGKKLQIEAYHLYDNDYKNFFSPIEGERLKSYPIEYDRGWVENEYLPRLKYLAHCLRKGVMPCADGLLTFTLMLKQDSKNSLLNLIKEKILGRITITLKNVTLKLK